MSSDPAYENRSRLLRPPTGSVTGDFPLLPANWFELSLGHASSQSSEDSLLLRSPEINELLSPGAQPVRYRVPLNIDSMSDGLNLTVPGRRHLRNADNLHEDDDPRFDLSERLDEKVYPGDVLAGALWKSFRQSCAP